MLDKETLKKKLFDMLNECNDQLSKYKELRAKGLSKDDTYEAILSTRQRTLSEILELISK